MYNVYFSLMVFMAKSNKVTRQSWRQRSLFYFANRVENMFLSLLERGQKKQKKKTAITHSKKDRKKVRKNKESQFPHDQWTNDVGSRAHNPREDNYFCVLVGRVFASGPRDRGSIPGRVIPKTQKMVLVSTLLNTQHYKVRIKGK